MHGAIGSLFQGFRLDDVATTRTIRQLYQETGELIDPHSAIGVAAGRARRRDATTPMVALATAHAAKFPDAVEAATGIRPALPPRLGDLFERPERYDVLPNELETVKDYVRQVARVNA
jgi:threonine synthase